MLAKKILKVIIIAVIYDGKTEMLLKIQKSKKKNLKKKLFLCYFQKKKRKKRAICHRK